MSAAGQNASASAWRRDLLLTLIALALLAAWEWSGLDLSISRLYGDANGFAWREAWLTAGLGHQGGRNLAWLIFIGLIIDAIRPWIARPDRSALPSPARSERRFWLLVTLACLIAIPALKQVSQTSCPWDLQEFGGSAPYVPHWLLGVQDGGGGHCFPSGHAIAAFAFFSQFFLWRQDRPAIARLWLAGVLVFGSLFGWAQLARGAHYVSHTMWSAWICWAICVAAAAWRARRVQA